ncbi:imidazolonepropionase-like amidohydrolase [Streptomyces sp. 3211.6]|uniref:amidohydrolase family protein n=1 Tax=Streptomyces TaxID=1883 RepID=UPI0009A49F89|nr:MULTISPECIES: amidohydrolase family protein [Streptomyces]RKT03640.1 imidazolonepropionase-like amidohydrolase [Streptomyces sp. 3211.6]RPF39509.1 imidazolonepropionase-like amidohydrolase [Streptomyces sp. Ag109_G2-6]
MKTALTNARVFDGRRLLGPATVVIDGGVIAAGPDGAREVDAGGAVLLPGLIDSHVHLHGPENLRQLRDHGVTTALDMATWPPALVDSLRAAPGLTDIRSPGTLAIAAGGLHSRMPGVPADSVVTGPADAERFVAARVAEGADYIKIVAERPGPGALDQATLDALVTAAHAHGRLVVAHTAASEAYAMAQRAGADVLTHVPADRPLDAAATARMHAAGRAAVPTLTMMEGLAAAGLPGLEHYDRARASTAALHRAGVRVLAGTDSNATPGVPFTPPHGSSLHHELELLVDAGLSPLDALRAATVLPARHFGLTDRGTIRPGHRADLLLIDGDPLTDIRATRRILRVWCAGVERPADDDGPQPERPAPFG